jgi:uncharacterized repeat protein (TIGR03803 family)
MLCVFCRNIFTLALIALAMVLAFAVSPASAQTFTTLYSFTGTPDGANPFGGLLPDGKGNYYGTTAYGGASNNGTVFELSPPSVGGGDWTETVIWNFAGGAGGLAPAFQLVMDGRGRLYGEAYSGGDGTCNCSVVFVLVPPETAGASWTEHVLWNLTGTYFYGGLTLGSSGSVYGIQQTGGAFGFGLAFKLAPTRDGAFTETTIYNFGANHTDSKAPIGPLTIGPGGNLFGLSNEGGDSDGVGTVYELSPPLTGTGLWSNTVLYSFNNVNGIGCYPGGNVVFDQQGRLYGQTTNCNATFFRLTPPTGSGSWTLANLCFIGQNDGVPYPSLTRDPKTGAFYGTSANGGTGYGAVYQLTPPAGGVGAWTDTVVHAFTGGSDGYYPIGPLVIDANGVLYGTDYIGDLGSGFGNGEVFSITP